ncbi:hypothetical protein V492_06908 [Pseudogymnoascus sp. VKM F-4246]|nr:hypothetical protein V492_06908 [Pseudogymnoascus sp. VKM F-4246]
MTKRDVYVPTVLFSKCIAMTAMPLASRFPTRRPNAYDAEVGAERWKVKRVVSTMPRGTALKRQFWMTKRLRNVPAAPYAGDGGTRQGAAAASAREDRASLAPCLSIDGFILIVGRRPPTEAEVTRHRIYMGRYNG